MIHSHARSSRARAVLKSLCAGAALALGLGLSAPAQAQSEADLEISRHIGSEGIDATLAWLDAMESHEDSQAFAVAGLNFLSAVERALQLRWESGLDMEVLSMLPVLRLPIEENPAPVPLQGERLSEMLESMLIEFDNTRSAVDFIEERDFHLDIDLADLWFDINGSGTREPGEELAAFVQLHTAGSMDDMGMMFDDMGNPIVAPEAGPEAAPIIVRFDTADAAWLRAYSNLLSAVTTLFVAYDPVASLAAVQADLARMEELRGPELPSEDFGPTIAAFLDRAVVVLGALEQQPLPEHGKAVLAHLKGMIADNRRFWELLGQESDDVREWIPAAGQTSALGVSLPEGTDLHWLAVLDELDAMLKGELLIPHWRHGETAGINLRKLLENPPAIDLVNMIQGRAFLPWAEQGELVSFAAWQQFIALTGGDAMMLAVWMN